MTSLKAYFRPGHRDEPAVASTDAELDALLDELMREGFDRSIAVLSVAEPGDGGYRALHVAVDPEGDVGALIYIDSTDAWYSKGTTSEREELFYCYYGEDRDFPRDAELTLATVRAAAAEFLHTGLRPTLADWQPW
ncbi:Imm1 family immunity protein [Phytomonospora endophytica]|uniref:Immunity protein Imm1 n=1 Tax=Phytomonospora endophytica TaxID=714109 RepID=A0A841FQ08_9ACTN|nr:Imm1 family immunity protein [Phytomonospora endophytica]MBB6036923.1 hypothetical protein [Phytomonospora endophytica]GIG68046.1 hypothetical protein Pen01_43410 [Phytomonospora endophytica]